MDAEPVGERRTRARWQANALRLATALIVVVVASAILVDARSDVVYTNALRSSRNVAQWNLEGAYYACLTHQVEDLVPRGTRVWVSQQAPNGASGVLALAKIVAPYTPLSDRSAGVVDLFLVKAAHTEGCLGVRVKAVAPDGAVRFGSGLLVSSLPLPGQSR